MGGKPGRDGGDDGGRRGRRRVTLKDVAAELGLSPATVSVVLNRSPVADSIPEETQERVFAAARRLRYRPNHLARSLRSRRTRTVGVLVPELDEPYATGVMAGVEEHLLSEGYFYLIASHRADEELLEEYLELLGSGRVDGLLLLASTLARAPELPAVVVSGHRQLAGVTNVVVDHDRAVRGALGHLIELGHERIAFVKGQPGSADTDDRWRAILEAAGELGIEVREELTCQLLGDPTGRHSRTEQAYREGYEFGGRLLAGTSPFTALFAFNDVSAIGFIRAVLDAGLGVPEDISVVGFDDIQSAAFHNPGLTTVRQPLAEMGRTAGRILLDRLDGTSYPDFVVVEPELVVRGSTGPAPARGVAGKTERRVAR